MCASLEDLARTVTEHASSEDLRRRGTRKWAGIIIINSIIVLIMSYLQMPYLSTRMTLQVKWFVHITWCV